MGASLSAKPLTQAAKALKMHDGGASSYRSLAGCVSVEGVNDAEQFTATLTAMKGVGMKGAGVEGSLRLVAAVLAINDLSFSAAQRGDAEGSRLSSKAERTLECVAGLLQADGAALAAALTEKDLHTMAAGGKVETYKVPLNPAQAAAARDAVAKSLYERLFDSLVGQVNN